MILDIKRGNICRLIFNNYIGLKMKINGRN
jgi:hypothetical protein